MKVKVPVGCVAYRYTFGGPIAKINSHRVPLMAAARSFVLSLLGTDNLVFTTTAATPVSGFGKLKTRLDARIERMRPIQGRGSMARASGLAELGRTWALSETDKGVDNSSTKPHCPSQSLKLDDTL
jgi:hypothetical protein